MTVEEIRGSVVSDNEIDKFPIGMRVLAVDDDPTCLKLLDGLLRKCHYQVTTTSQAKTALKMVRENRHRFDLVISDVHMPDMDGFKLLELVGLEMDLPVIMLSGNSDPKLVMKGVTHGACDYLVKPVRLEELRNIWQHVIRRKVNSKSKNKPNQGSEGGGGDQNEKLNRKRKDEDEDVEENEQENDDPSSQKKPRVVWSIDLHRKFVAAVNQLGIEKAVPKRILDLMNVEGITRENVASHLQKYRLYLKRISQQANTMVAFGGSKDASSYARTWSLDELGDFRTLSRSSRLPNAAVPSYSPSLIQPNLTPSVGSFNKFQPVVSPNHPKMNLFHGIPLSFGIADLQQYNTQNTQLTDFISVDKSRIFTGSSTFTDLSSESFNLGSSGSSFLDQTGSSNPLPMGETFLDRLPHNNGGFGSSFTTMASVPLESQTGGLVGDIVRTVDPSLSNQNQRRGEYSKQDYAHYSNDAFSTLASSAPVNRGGLGGRVSQGGFVANNGYDSLDVLMNGMMKQEQGPVIMMDGEFEFDPSVFGSCI